MKVSKLSVACIVAAFLIQPTVYLAKLSWVEIAVAKDSDRYYLYKQTLHHQNNIAWFWVYLQSVVSDSDGFSTIKL